jgi:hypothetical protein
VRHDKGAKHVDGDDIPDLQREDVRGDEPPKQALAPGEPGHIHAEDHHSSGQWLGIVNNQTDDMLVNHIVAMEYAWATDLTRYLVDDIAVGFTASHGEFIRLHQIKGCNFSTIICSSCHPNLVSHRGADFGGLSMYAEG